MLLKRLFILTVIILGSQLLHAQEINGEWTLTKVTAQLFSQQDNKLLQQKTLTTDSSLSDINGRVPVSLLFGPQDYVMKSRSGTEKGTYVLHNNNRLELKNGMQPVVAGQPVLPGIQYHYSLSSTALQLDMPAAFYKDNKRNLAVKLVYTCYYAKKA
jgi:hypothetical protein